MVNEVVRLLIESVFLALPATAIYLQIISSNHTRLLADNTQINTADEWPDYHFTRVSILFLSLSAVFGILHILINRSPVLIEQYRYSLSQLLGLLIFLQILALLTALCLFVCGVFVSKPRLSESEQSILGAIRAVK